MLLVHGDPVLRDHISKRVKWHGLAELQSAATGLRAASMILAGGFDIALINATLPDASGIELAKLAAIPVLMLSETPRISRKLARLGLQFMEKPFGVDALLAESRRVMLERGADTPPPSDPPIAAAAQDLEALRAEIAEAHRQFDAIVKHLGYLKT